MGMGVSESGVVVGCGEVDENGWGGGGSCNANLKEISPHA